MGGLDQGANVPGQPQPDEMPEPRGIEGNQTPGVVQADLGVLRQEMEQQQEQLSLLQTVNPSREQIQETRQLIEQRKQQYGDFPGAAELIKPMEDLLGTLENKPEKSASKEAMEKWKKNCEKIRGTIEGFGSGTIKFFAVNFFGKNNWISRLLMKVANSPRAQKIYLLKSFPALQALPPMELSKLRGTVLKAARDISALRKKNGDPEWDTYDFVSVVEAVKENFDANGTQNPTKETIENEVKTVLTKENEQAANTSNEAEKQKKNRFGIEGLEDGKPLPLDANPKTVKMKDSKEIKLSATGVVFNGVAYKIGCKNGGEYPQAQEIQLMTDANVQAVEQVTLIAKAGNGGTTTLGELEKKLMEISALNQPKLKIKEELELQKA